MEPQLPAPRPSGEMGPLPTGGETPRAPERAPEAAPQQKPESQPEQGQAHEQRTVSSGGDPTFVAPQPLVLPKLPDPSQVRPAQSTAAADDNPTVAGDDDLIEKEWVERAKKIVASTKNDPYLQEQEVSKLQADYLKKRYGKEVRLPAE